MEFIHFDAWYTCVHFEILPLRRRTGAFVQNPEVNDDKLNGFLACTKIERNMFNFWLIRFS